MRKLTWALLATALLLGAALPVSAEGAKRYQNCKALNADYPGGVAKAAGIKNKGGKTKYKPLVSKALYEANKKSDRDKDGIACER
ncbi:excalibur calcium-binding domain-containing protein [Paenibacillus durus]|uniref:Excalibur calcium-binding domain-containing protein n=1 Tax=Paenibacillus durus TaxID=44251 RepID=A0A089ISF6_PAEDU|nr:excalibur calcium-binding domain-containing protein [Paenibacillus durus]AIQ11944.1 hypothetical protein PDUR_08345 [Paenibacillus durus]